MAEVVSSEVTPEPLRAYNLTVEGWHTYFVAANEDAAPVWVHNDCLERILRANKPNATDERLQNIYKQLFRDQDIRPGGTAGELLREIDAGGHLRHLLKTKERAKQLVNILSDTNSGLSRLDRIGAERVLQDLRTAIAKAN